MHCTGLYLPGLQRRFSHSINVKMWSMHQANPIVQSSKQRSTDFNYFVVCRQVTWAPTRWDASPRATTRSTTWASRSSWSTTPCLGRPSPPTAWSSCPSIRTWWRTCSSTRRSAGYSGLMVSARGGAGTWFGPAGSVWWMFLPEWSVWVVCNVLLRHNFCDTRRSKWSWKF